ncbi:TetR/AcrR family transcriptional regulator [Amycolatopsis pithecellobii]|uniref:TetR family transcriptional regulator n=1 Tax=Amycolatopsis pithecellobii TaxID=664692 RepID=A0A6N7Z0F2_9PSEU|nr:TetR/AcrR family transcriptional regulator [Amycolatopsis pithecellobii]MTD52914.1 TetR family transcriptional regulator [Amycolatopsis pithecellobii]
MPRTQKERNEETRRALLEAGSSLLREVGYARTSVAQITQRAGRAHGTFYLHFENKRHLVSVLLDDMAEEARRHAREIWRAAPRVDAIWLGLRDFLALITPERSLWLLVEEVVALEEDAAPLRSRLRHLYVEPILRGLKERPDGLVSRAPNIELLADLLASMGLHFARTGNLPASPDVTALHMTVVWCNAVGQPITEKDLDNLRGMFAAS